MILNFKNFINESIADIFNYKRSYQDEVQSQLVHIFMKVNGISEKDFNRVDNTINNVREMIKNNNKVIDIITSCEKEGKRVEYCAELIYDQLIKK